MSNLLNNKTVLITRRREQASDLHAVLEAHGARVVFLPTIQVIPPDSWDQCDAALRLLDQFQLIVFASVNAVTFFLHRCVTQGITPELLSQCELAVVGRKTGAELERLKLRPQHIPDEYSTSALLEYFRQYGVSGRRILLPRGSLGKQELIDGLKALGADVHPIPVYKTVSADLKGAEPTIARIFRGEIDVISFASPSAVNNFASVLPGGTLSAVSGKSRIAVIGSTTAGAVRNLGLEPEIRAQEATSQGLADAIAAYYATPRTHE